MVQWSTETGVLISDRIERQVVLDTAEYGGNLKQSRCLPRDDFPSCGGHVVN